MILIIMLVVMLAVWEMVLLPYLIEGQIRQDINLENKQVVRIEHVGIISSTYIVQYMEESVLKKQKLNYTFLGKRK